LTSDNFVTRAFEWLVRRASNKTLTISWLATLLLTTIATLQTWNFIGEFLNDFTIGVFMLVGGLQLYIETLFEDGFDPAEKSDVLGMITATFALLYGIGLTFGYEMLVPHFGGVQGGVLSFLVASLIFEGIANRKGGTSGAQFI